MMDTVSLEGLDKTAVFAALFNRSKPQGLGFLQYDPEEMTADTARERFNECSEYFDYVDGRVMKIDLSGDEMYTGGYNRDNGIGAAEAVIDTLRDSGSVNSEDARRKQSENTRTSAMYTKEHLTDKKTTKMKGDILKVELTTAWAADELAPKLNAYLKSIGKIPEKTTDN